MPKVSVIIPAYNAANSLPATLESVFNQTYRDFEVIVVDDGSIDETEKVLSSYEGRIRWEAQEHQGQAYAVNHGIRMAAGDYLAYLDADDIFLPAKIEVQTRYLDGHPDIDVVYTDMYRATAEGNKSLDRYRPIDAFRLLQRCCVSRITVMHRKDCLARVGMFNEGITGSDDWDMWVRMSEECRIAYIPEALSEYRIHGKNTSLTRHKRLDHYRWSRMVILRDAYLRRGKPVWLLLMVVNARIQWALGKIPFAGESMPRFWALADRIQMMIERVLFRRIATQGQRPTAQLMNRTPSAL